MSLASLPRGRRARVESVDGGSAFARRLLELGFVPGTVVRAMGSAPLGDPLMFELRGTRLSLRRAEAAGIRVEPLEGADG